ncbi:MAG TPA: mechanosensitive ion channel family protein [Streptosporangiaceae bacterium]|nr:mechanosensitive ion channel family protein [Streptosporangiaceae bacterium]
MLLDAHLPAFSFAHAPGTLVASCGHDPGIGCRMVWDLSHSGTAAKLTAVYLAGPANVILKLIWLVFLALVARVLVHRLINRVTIRAADAPLAHRLRQGSDTRRRLSRLRHPIRVRELERAHAEFTAEQATAEAAREDAVLVGAEAAMTGSTEPEDMNTATEAVTQAVSERRHQRSHALGSILRNAASVTIFTIAVTIGLGDLGVNLAPVLASAGVVGIAVGFGAQNLVRDFLAGIFMLMEDQYGVGDVINIGDATGTVEAVSLRTTRLRDINGVVWHIRNGALEKVGNESQGWARAVVDVPAPPELDLADTRKIMEQAAATMWHERRWRKLMLEKPEVWGVQAITDTQVTMRVAAKTLPLRQYEAGRELRERVVSAIDLALLDLEVEPQPGRTAAQLAAVGEETRRPKSPRTTMRSRTGHAGGDDPISEEIEPKDRADAGGPASP